MCIDVGDFQLSPYRSDDAAALVEHLADGVVAQTVPVIPYPYGMPEAEAFLAGRLAEQSQAPTTAFAFRSADGLLCGAVGLSPNLDEQSAELGYWLAPHLWGRGLIGSAVPVLLQYAESLPLVSITARAITTNHASIAILRRSGFSSLGICREPARTTTGVHNAELFKLILPVSAA
ncbi:putative ribosomal N-acetyltransferase YdaF [Pseudobythopirellula maris]|uniref:Putative ribosomal N-acetyltransferase YdaF n=1 Tax=Pseudobythopirellula maris TaxID=2527991 RepID=A0A5C5ZMA0_9BACT|nr:GNAT family N-acetyltransferase [Pseudobythopirellula maris]TWT88529.1 putative ribosomal N-acetyltransferase YdaF [Pseudobythopirellula maris]